MLCTKYEVAATGMYVHSTLYLLHYVPCIRYDVQGTRQLYKRYSYVVPMYMCIPMYTYRYIYLVRCTSMYIVALPCTCLYCVLCCTMYERVCTALSSALSTMTMMSILWSHKSHTCTHPSPSTSVVRLALDLMRRALRPRARTHARTQLVWR